MGNIVYIPATPAPISGCRNRRRLRVLLPPSPTLQSTLDGMLVHRKATPAFNLLVLLPTLGRREALNTRGTLHYAKIPVISVGSQMERSVSVRSDRNARNHLWRWPSLIGWSEICRSILANRFIALFLFSRFHQSGGFGKGIKMEGATSFGWPGLIGKCRSIFLGWSRWSLTISHRASPVITTNIALIIFQAL